MQVFNVKLNSRKCAFCQYWHDPAMVHIAPRHPVGGFWEYDEYAWSVCKKRGGKVPANGSCMDYVCKV